MTDTTDIKALREKPDHGPYALVMAQNEALAKGIVDLQIQLEAERQRADENQAGSNTFKSIIGYIKDAQRNETFGLWKEASDRLNADGCNGTANHVIEYLEELNKAFESEAELAALKGNQVPVDDLQAEIRALMRTYALVSSPSTMAAAHDAGYAFVKAKGFNRILAALFTAPQKPVVLPAMQQLKEAVDFYLQVQKENPPIEQGMHKDADEWLKRAAIEAAGDIVKGE